MGKGVVLLIALIIIGLSIGSYYLFFYEKTESGIDDLNGETQKTTNNLEECEKITHPSEKNACYTTIAKEEKDLSICDIINNFYCYGDVAGAKKDISICEEIENTYTRDYCYRKVAAGMKDFSICGKIVNKKQRNDESCYEEVAQEKKDISVCDNINTQYKDDCLLGSAKGLLDDSICEQIVDSISKDECYVFIAIEKQDESLCEKATINEETCKMNID